MKRFFFFLLRLYSSIIAPTTNINKDKIKDLLIKTNRIADDVVEITDVDVCSSIDDDDGDDVERFVVVLHSVCLDTCCSVDEIIEFVDTKVSSAAGVVRSVVVTVSP